MAIPTKKMYDRKGKLVFDPNNPEDVRNYKEKQPLLEALKLVQGLTDPRGGSGLTGMTRVISKAAGAKMAKSRYTKNKAKQILDLVTKPMTKGKKSVPKTTPTVKEVVETKLDIPTTIPSTMELAQIPGSSAKTVKEGIKSFTGKTEKFVPKTNRLITRANSRAGNLKPFKGGTTRPGSTPMNYTPTDPSKALSVKELPEILFMYKPDKVPFTTAEKIKLGLLGTAFTGLLGGAAYQGYKSTKVGESKLDLNNINENDLRDSKVYKDVKILKTSTGDKGIIKDPATGKWKYFDEKKGVRLPKGKVGLGDGPPIGLGDKTNTGGSGTGGGTKPRSATGQAFDKAFAEARKQAGGAGGIFEWNGKKYGTALVGETIPKDRVEVGKTTTPIMGDEEYKKDPRLATLRQEDDNRQLLARAEAQKKEMKEFKPTIPLSSLVFKTTSESINKRNTMDEQNALQSIRENNKLPLKKKRYGGNLAMLKYMK